MFIFSYVDVGCFCCCLPTPEKGPQVAPKNHQRPTQIECPIRESVWGRFGAHKGDPVSTFDELMASFHVILSRAVRNNGSNLLKHNLGARGANNLSQHARHGRTTLSLQNVRNKETQNFQGPEQYKVL